ncbi:MAG: redoxin domain-containing protein [Phycisphaerales bacterium]|nr:redoxin domain-containing protein [Phycisphaerales bacterium]
MPTSTPTLTPRPSIIAVGDTAPDFTLQTQDRGEWRLSDAVKKGDVVLCLFPFAFTGVCGTEMKCVTQEMASWTKKGSQVVGLSCDSPFTLKAWAEKEGFTHTLLSDQHRKVTQALGLYWADMNTTQRGTIVISKSEGGQGKVKWVQARQPGNAMDWNQVLSVIS